MSKVRVAIVDDNPWTRRGRASTLDTDPAIDVKEVADHTDALLLDGRWASVDVALVDAVDHDQPFDRFPGVRVTDALKAWRPEATVVVTSPHPLDDYLRIRLVEAGADYLYCDTEIRDVSALVEAVLRPRADHRLTKPSPECLIALGVSPEGEGTSLNAALAYVEERGMAELLHPDVPLRSSAVGRRSIITARRRLAAMLGLRPHRDGSEIPEWRRVAAFLNRARGLEFDQQP